MMRRLVDAVLAATALLVLAPVLALAALGIRLSSPGPVVYRAQRIGQGARPFTMYKLRTMQVNQSGLRSSITAANDPRVFPLGAWLRRTKIDELPQLYNVLRGDMAIVGPRPEAPQIVEQRYSAIHCETLRVRPGLASPGSLYNMTHGEKLIGSVTPEEDYLELLFPVKLALDVVYTRRASFLYDIRMMTRAVWLVLTSLGGRRTYPLPPEYDEALRLLEESAASAVERRS